MPLFKLQLDGQMTDAVGDRVFPETIETDDWRAGLIVNGVRCVVIHVDHKIGGNIEIIAEPIERLRYVAKRTGKQEAEQFSDVDEALAWIAEPAGLSRGTFDWSDVYEFAESVSVYSVNDELIGSIRRTIVSQPATA